MQPGQTAQIFVIHAFFLPDYREQIDNGIGNFVGFTSLHCAKMRVANDATPPD